MPLLPYDHVSFPVWLDLIAPFDKVDHKILIHTKCSFRLQTEFALGGRVLVVRFVCNPSITASFGRGCDV